MILQDLTPEDLLKLTKGLEKKALLNQSTKGGVPFNDKALVEVSEPQIEEALKPQSEYVPLPFEDAVELLFFVDENIASGEVELYDWQIETLLFLCGKKFTFENKLKFLLSAANGSGKDAYILAAFAVWQLTCRVRSRFIGTSKSANQINTQTNPYIKSLCQRLGAKLIQQGWHPNPFIYRTKPFQIICNFTGAEILTFVTDEAENAEGYHPPQDAPKADLTIAINEAKGVPDDLFEAFSRCTFNRWIEVTSPGRMSGKNWEHYSNSVKYPQSYEDGKFYSRKVTSYDCKHKSIKSIEEDAIDFGGKESELFRSKHLAEYTSAGEKVVISLEVIDKFYGPTGVLPLWDSLTSRAAGLDLSLGGDETVLVVRKGNAVKSLDGIRIRDATILEQNLDKLFPQRGLTKADPIYTDVGGLGKPIAQTLTKMGWKIIYVLNNGEACGFDKHLYSNRGTEIYYEVCNFFARGYIRMEITDPIWRDQLGTRKYIRMPNDKIKLQPKKELEADDDKKTLSNSKLWNSPDRADAWVLCFTDWEPQEVKLERESKGGKPSFKRITQNHLVKVMEEERWKGYGGSDRPRIGGPLKQQEIIRAQLASLGLLRKGN